MLAIATHWINGLAGGDLSASDRGALYGQSLFETIAINNGQALLLEAHLDRLIKGCQVLSIPIDRSVLINEIESVCKQLAADKKQVMRLTITMGRGGRGYKNPQKPAPTRLISLHDYPANPSTNWTKGIKLGLSDIRLSRQPILAGLKHGNRLEQVLARNTWQDDWQEALLLDQSDNVIEATQSNIFIVQDGIISTPDLSQCGVNGVMRDFVLSQASNVGARSQIMPLSLSDIETADEVFVTNSIIGLWPVKRFQNTEYGEFNLSQKLLTTMQDHEAI